PVAAYESTYSNKGKTLNVNINTGYELFRSFYLKLNGGIDQQVFEEIVLSPSTMYNPAFGITPANSAITKANQHRFSYLLEPQVNYKRTFNEQEIDILAGGT